MADKTITQLPVASAIGTTDVSVLVSNNIDYQFDFALLLQFISSNISTGSAITFGTVLPQNNTGNNGDVFFKTDTPSFYQKTNGAWIQTYAEAAVTTTGSSLLYGQGMPGSTIGNNNDSYINTVTGIFYQKVTGTWSQVFSMATGPQGPQGTAGTNGISGTNGNTLLSGTTDPANTIGNNGDYYINLSTYAFFGPKTLGAWSSGVSLIGEAGATGQTGATGPQGIQGPAGVAGATGATGTIGATGAQGTTGATGPAGAAGTTGETGATGAQGTPGATGPAGPGVVAGGTAGQVLAKIDGTDYHTQWINPPASGGSSSGDAVTTETFNSTIGDLTTLVTDDKSSIVEAINEVAEDISSLSQTNVILNIFKKSNYS